MKSILGAMKKKKNGIPEDIVPIFEGIIRKHQEYAGPNLTGVRFFDPEWDDDFGQAMNEHLTKEQRFKLYEENGACNGTGADKERKAFARANAHIPLAARLELFEKTFHRCKAVLNDDKTITVKFACQHGYYKKAREGKYQAPPKSVESYFERCAGGRLYEYQKALGVRLRIKAVDVSALMENVNNPVEFTFEVVD